jgi:hemerythrin-like domain-containing protein
MSDESGLKALADEHRALAKQVGALVRGLERLRDGPEYIAPEELGDLRRQVKALRRSLVIHRAEEEIGLFPEVEALVAEGPEDTDVLRQFFAGEAEDDITAHVAIEQGVHDIASLLDGLKRRDTDEMRTKLFEATRATAGLLGRHARKEDTVIFPMILRVLSEEQIAAVSARMQELRQVANESWRG